MSSLDRRPSAADALAVLVLFTLLLAIVAFFGYCCLIGMTHVLGVTVGQAVLIYVGALITEVSIIKAMKAIGR